MSYKLDVVILTVLQEEYDAVCRKIVDLKRWPGYNGNANLYAWQVGTVQYPTMNCSYSIAIGMTGRAGNSQSTAATTEAIRLWQPRYILLIGVAGGLSGMNKGDILIAEEIWGYEYGKIEDGFHPRNDLTFHTDIGLRNGAVAYALKDEWRALISLKPPKTCSSKIEVGKIASGDKVVDNPDDAFFERVLEAYPKAKGAEMEGAGACQAIEQCQAQGKKVGFLMVRGISDEPRAIDEKDEIRGTPERDDWKPYASDAAAAFAIGYISSGLPEMPYRDEKATENSDETARIPHEIPAPPDDFTGREEELNQLLNDFGNGAAIAGLRGMGGIGKTALAYKLAEMIRDRYPDGQLKVDLNGTGLMPLKPSEGMEQIIHSYDIGAKLPDDEIAVAKMYRSLLDGKRALILLDNAADDKQVSQLIPPKPNGVIVTSRLIFTLPGMNKIDLETLKPEKAVELLLKVYGYDMSSPIFLQQEETWKEIARLCGYLPLALRAAGSMLANTLDLSPAQYLEGLKIERTRLEMIGKEGVDLDIEASFNLSYVRLPAETAHIFRSLSVFPADFDPEAEEEICQDEGHRHLSEILKWSLIEFQKEAKRYRLHDLVRIFAGKRKEDEDGVHEVFNDQYRHAIYYWDVLSQANQLYLQGKQLEGLRLFDTEWVNIQSGESWAEINSGTNDFAAEICKTYPDAGAQFFPLRLPPSMRISWLKSALAASRKLRDRRAEGCHSGNLGQAYEDLGDSPKAIKYHMRALRISREIGDRKGEEDDLNGLGNAYAHLGNHKKAIKFFDKALVIAHEIRDERGEAYALGNLGIANKNLGEVQKATEYYEKSLKILHNIKDRRGEAKALNNLGTAYSEQGYYKKSIEYYNDALDVAYEIGDRRTEGKALSGLGQAYINLDEASIAIKYCEQSLAIARAREIGDRRSEAISLSILGQAYAILGEAQEAIKYLGQAQTIAHKIKDRNVEGASLGNLGVVYTKQGNIPKALEYYEKHLAIAREIGDRKGEGNALFNISSSLDSLGLQEKAIENGKAALAIFEQIESQHAEIVRQKLSEWQEQD